MEIFAIPLFTAFIMHELGHRQVARSLGYPAEFQIFWKWFFGAIILSAMTLFRFVFFAPGAVVIYTNPYTTEEEHYKIAIAGPKMNLVFGILGLAWLALDHSEVAFYTAGTNMFIGLFNLIPIMPLDGGRVFSYSKKLWVMWFVVFLTGFILTGFAYTM